IEARRKQMDIIGTYSVAMVTAFGGGTLRDLLIGHYPLFWMQNYNYPLFILGLSVISILFLRKAAGFSKPILSVTRFQYFSNSHSYTQHVHLWVQWFL
ncbi:MAG TPA: TRIC cation channel family protein, partial [Ignavibacteria bacterium]|nr:TRIC cation channel family protein [Ignavibacteria bacterium]